MKLPGAYFSRSLDHRQSKVWETKSASARDGAFIGQFTSFQWQAEMFRPS